MNKILIRLFFVFSIFLGLSVTPFYFSNSFTSAYADDTLTQREILYFKLQNFFGELKGTFRYADEKLSDQIASGLEEYDLLADRQQVDQLPKVGNNLYLETGSTAHDWPLFSAVVLTSSEKVVSAALLDSAGLAIFLRSSPENSLYITTFRKWAKDVWCSKSPVYGDLGFGMKFNQKFDPSDCSPLPVKIIYLSGYGNKSVN